MKDIIELVVQKLEDKLKKGLSGELLQVFDLYITLQTIDIENPMFNIENLLSEAYSHIGLSHPKES